MAVYALLATSTQGALADSSSMLPDTFQMSPSGYSGAVNTPTADVLPVASTVFSVTNSIPERARKYPGIGVFGGLNWGFGVLPGLELVGRLTYDGNVQCNEFDNKAKCPTTARDLSLSGKYQLPVALPLNTRIAMGFTDYGGTAAANYKQLYAVGTTSHGPVDASVGYSKAGSKNSLMDGIFGSLTARVTDQLAVVLESDTQARRLGAHYLQPLSNDLDLQIGLSRKLSGPIHQQTNQITAALRYQLDKKIRTASQKKSPAWSSQKPAETTPQTLDQRASALAHRMAADGFSNIQISALPATGDSPLLWWIQAEPVGWRKDHQQALGAGLVSWMLGNETDDTEVVLSLTYMGRPTSSVHTSRNCLIDFAMGQDMCTGKFPLRFLRGTELPQRLQTAKPEEKLTLISNAASFAWKPQIELGPSLRTTVGTEFGLADYSAALNLSGQVQLDIPGWSDSWNKGWMWQGNVLIPVTRSGDFEKNRPYYLMGHTQTEVGQALLSYWQYLDTPWFKDVAIQASVGSISTITRGGQIDAVWMNPEGDLRVGATAGTYSRKVTSGTRKTQTPTLVSVRQTVIPSQWQLEGTYGKFLSGDTGYKISSHHWFGDYRLSFFIHESEAKSTMPKTRFAGFEISLPIGPKASVDTGWGNVRGEDRWGWGLKTKIGQSNNRLTSGYGEIPVPKHGVWTDITSHDRNGPINMWGGRSSLRAALQQSDQHDARPQAGAGEQK